MLIVIPWPDDTACMILGPITRNNTIKILKIKNKFSALNKMRVKGIFFKITKAIYHKLTANIILSGENLKAFLRSSTQAW